MNTTFEYVVLRLAADQIRGEVINVGIVLFGVDTPARVITMATLNKLRAIDVSWSASRLAQWVANAEAILQAGKGTKRQIETLERFGLCEASAVGMFVAKDAKELTQRLNGIRARYVSNKAKDGEVAPRKKRNRLQTAMRDQFKKMHVLGAVPDDIAQHLVVPNVPVPGHDEFKTDFVYKNGVYRITQTLDYNVAPDSLHNKLAETCVKTMAGELAMQAYGSDTLRLAVVDVPAAFADAADSHVDLLLARGFEVFHFGDANQMAKYFSKATPALG